MADDVTTVVAPPAPRRPMGPASVRAWLTSDPVRTVLDRVIAEPRQVLIDLGRDPAEVGYLGLTEATTDAITAVLGDELEERVADQIARRIAPAVANAHAAGRADGWTEGIQAAADRLRTAAEIRAAADPVRAAVLEEADALEEAARADQ